MIMTILSFVGSILVIVGALLVIGFILQILTEMVDYSIGQSKKE